MNTVSAFGLMGLSCDCERQVTRSGLGAESIIGMAITSPKAVNIYKAPGGAVVRVSTPYGYIGKVWATNTAGTWIQLSRADEWIITDPSYSFTPHFTQFQLDDYAKRISSAPRQQSDQAASEVEQAVSQKNFNPFDAISSPVESMLKKYAVPAIFIAGGIYLAATFGKAFIQGKLSQTKAA